jgi:N6-adenosine-specific RNA methylase IME4
MTMGKTMAKRKPAALALPHCTLSRVGLQFDGQLTSEQWQEIGKHLEQFAGSSQWWLGDWLLHGEGRTEWGSMYDQVVEEFDEKYGTARNAKWLAEKFDLSRRRDKLPWGHHAEVAGLESEEQQDELLDWAEDNGKDGKPATRKQLRERVREVRKANRLAATPEQPAGVFDIIYADPPWMYTSGDQHGKEEQDTVLSTHYPSMPTDELCELPVSSIAADDCVLFMWATCPCLKDALRILEAWGFEYKAQMVWDKVKHNVGNYVSVRHELLLICTKGQPPKVPKLVDSVYSEERTQHSCKPEYFRKVIESMYPSGKRIELFRRGGAPDGWTVWGNEAEG